MPNEKILALDALGLPYYTVRNISIEFTENDRIKRLVSNGRPTQIAILRLTPLSIKRHVSSKRPPKMGRLLDITKITVP